MAQRSARRRIWTVLWRDRRGVSALEFALIAPVLMLMFFGLGELGQGFMAQRRATSVAASIGDLAAQAQTLHDTDVANIFAAGAVIMQPLATSPLQMRLTSVTGNASAQAIVDWSDGYGGLTANTVGATITGLPTGLIANSGDNAIIADVHYHYTSPISVVLPNGLQFNETFYFRPRLSAKVTRVSP
ncbi:MAG: TadE/TadG family type IV pilus assembly protein [Pseudomonadota bacterium]|jgi:Flp pilus assembly protein TadG